MSGLSRTDKTHLEAAEGWLGLGNHLEANEELENITAALRAHPDVLAVRCKMYVEARKWEMVVEIGRTLGELQPEKAFGVLHQAHALRQLNEIKEARDVLLSVAEKFRDEWRVAYQLASYCSLLGDREAGTDWLEKAIDAAGKLDIRLKALEDPDLKIVWTAISEI
jgi:thioredoxin-like negative regulator of GroEL